MSLGQLFQCIDITVEGFEFNTRIGYDKLNHRCYFEYLFITSARNYFCWAKHIISRADSYNMDIAI